MTDEFDPTPVGFHDVLHDREPEPRTLTLPREAVVQAIELLENALVLGDWNPGAIVAHGEPYLTFVEGHEDIDLYWVPAVFVGVGQQIEQRVRDRAAIGADHQ